MTAKTRSWGSDWQALAIEAAAGVGAFLAAVIYSVVALAYSEFYSELGVRPADAGVALGTGLAGVAGVTVLILATAVVGLAVLVAAVWAVGKAVKLSGRKIPVGLANAASGRGAVVLGAVLALLLGLAVIVRFISAADEWADYVKRGEPVETLAIRDIEILGVRADFARVEPVGDGKDSLKLQVLARRPRENPQLFYLGRSNSDVLLYDSKSQRSHQIPSGLVVVTAINCETARSTEPACLAFRGSSG